MHTPVRPILPALCLALTALLAADTARAAPVYPGLALDRFDPAERGSDWFNLDSLDLRGEVRGAAGLTLDYGYRPLVEYHPDGSTSALVANQLFAHAGGSLVLLDRLRIGVNLPVALYQNGNVDAAAGTSYGGPANAAIGDLRVGADLRLFGQGNEPFTVAIGLQAFLPTGSQSNYDGDGQVRLAPRLQIAGQVAWFVYAARLGYVWRPNDTPIDQVSTGSELQGGASIGIKVIHDLLTFGPEVYGATSVASGSSLFTSSTSPLEGVLGLHYQLGDFKIGGGAGPGFTRGFGSPVVRGLFSFEWAPRFHPPEAPLPYTHTESLDRDGDGIPDPSDACPDVAGVRTTDPQTNGCPPPPAPVEVVPPPDRDGDGILDSADACPDTPGVASADPALNGCPPKPRDADGDGVPDAQDNCPTVPGPASNQGCPIKQRQLVVITKDKLDIKDRVYFATAKATIQKRSFPLLDQVAAVLVAHPEIGRLVIEGHSDNVGKPEKNRQLSQARASAVRSYLVKQGVAGERIGAKGYGPDRPIDTNSTAAGKANNRRVEFKIAGGDQTGEPSSP